MNQKTTWIIVLFAILAACKQPPKSESDVLKICADVDLHLKEYKMRSIDGYPDPDKRKINAFYEDDRPKMIITELYTDTSRVFSSYYIQLDQLLFCRQEIYSYNRPYYLTEDSARHKGDSTWYDDKKTVLKIYTYFFNKNKLSKWLDEHQHQVGDKDEFEKKQNELIGDCLLSLKLLNNKKED